MAYSGERVISISSLEWGILAGTDIEVRKTLVIEKGIRRNTTFVSGSHKTITMSRDWIDLVLVLTVLRLIMTVNRCTKGGFPINSPMSIIIIKKISINFSFFLGGGGEDKH